MTKKPVNWFRPRVLAYSVLAVLATVSLAALLIMQKQFRVELLRGKGMPFQILKQTEGGDLIQNQFEIRVENDDDHALEVKIQVQEDAAKIFNLIIPEMPIHLASHEKRGVPFFIQVSRDHLQGKGSLSLPLLIQIQGPKTSELKKEVVFIGPQSEIK